MKTKSHPNLAGKIGMEREMIRINSEAMMHASGHPQQQLGDSFFHKHITTDFAEAQIETVLSATNTINKLYDDHQTILAFIHYQIAKLDQYLWPYSMPPLLPKNDDDIQIANYHSYNATAKNKELYRLGLKSRYGPRMQCISGIHVNLSINPEIALGLTKVNKLYENFQLGYNKETISANYLALMRNFFRHSHCLTYLFGASPCFDKSFLEGDFWKMYDKQILPKSTTNHDFQKLCYDQNTYYYLNATSIRSTELGYFPKKQQSLHVSYNSLNKYIESMQKLLMQTEPDYADYESHQMNKNLLQIENEHYAAIRPKVSNIFKQKNNEKTLDLIQKNGIGYLEIRCLDISPSEFGGISKEIIAFLQLYFYYCLLKESPLISNQETQTLTANTLKVAWSGHALPDIENRSQQIFVVSSKKHYLALLTQICLELQPLAIWMDDYYGSDLYCRSIELQRQKIANPEQLPSTGVLTELKKFKSYAEMGLARAKTEHLHYLKQTIPKNTLAHLLKLTKHSLQKKHEIT